MEITRETLHQLTDHYRTRSDELHQLGLQAGDLAATDRFFAAMAVYNQVVSDLLTLSGEQEPTGRADLTVADARLASQIGERLERAAATARLDAEQIADQTGLIVDAVATALAGTELATPREITQIARVLGVDAMWVATGESKRARSLREIVADELQAQKNTV